MITAANMTMPEVDKQASAHRAGQRFHKESRPALCAESLSGAHTAGRKLQILQNHHKEITLPVSPGRPASGIITLTAAQGSSVPSRGERGEP